MTAERIAPAERLVALRRFSVQTAAWSLEWLSSESGPEVRKEVAVIVHVGDKIRIESERAGQSGRAA